MWHYDWSSAIDHALSLPVHQDLELSKQDLPHPTEAGFVLSVGDPAGQQADYRLPLDDGRGVHVKEYEITYKIHWDHKDPGRDIIGHIVEDAPHWLPIIGIGVFGLIVWLSSESRKGDN